MEKLQKFLSKNWLFIFSPILFFIGIIGMVVIVLLQDIKYGIYFAGSNVFMACVVFVVCISYKKHNKNVMKAVLGALLAFMCANGFNNAFNYSVYFESDAASVINTALSCLIAVSEAVFFINHLILASDHKSNSGIIGFNMIAALCAVLFSIAWGVFAVACGTKLYDYLYAICWIFFQIGAIILAINIETKIDYFKKIRDEKESAKEAESES